MPHGPYHQLCIFLLFLVYQLTTSNLDFRSVSGSPGIEWVSAQESLDTYRRPARRWNAKYINSISYITATLKIYSPSHLITCHISLGERTWQRAMLFYSRILHSRQVLQAYQNFKTLHTVMHLLVCQGDIGMIELLLQFT